MKRRLRGEMVFGKIFLLILLIIVNKLCVGCCVGRLVCGGFEGYDCRGYGV